MNCCLHSFRAAACSRAAVSTLCLELGAAQCSLAAPGGPGKTLHGALAPAAASANLIAAEGFPAAKVCGGGAIRVPTSVLASSCCSLPPLPSTEQTLLHRGELAGYDGKEIASAAHKRPFSRIVSRNNLPAARQACQPSFKNALVRVMTASETMPFVPGQVAFHMQTGVHSTQRGRAEEGGTHPTSVPGNKLH